MSFPVFDLHCDTASALCRRDLSGYMSLRRNNLHIDLERAKRAKANAEEALKSENDDKAMLVLKAKLARAINRINVAELK